MLDHPDGWGPTTEPDELKGIPYAPFIKGEKLGRIADFAQTGWGRGGGGGGRYPQGQGVINFFADEARQPVPVFL